MLERAEPERQFLERRRAELQPLPLTADQVLSPTQRPTRNVRLPGTTATISGSVVSVAQVPISTSNARSGADARTNMPTHRVPVEDDLP